MSNITDSFNTFVSNLSTNVNTISTTFNSLQNDIINNQFIKCYQYRFLFIFKYWSKCDINKYWFNK